MFIQKKAYAKINLYLKILDKLPNGYHNILTVMQRISLCDDIKINIKDKGSRSINIICSDKNIGGNTNTAYKAADLFLERSGLTWDIDIEIEKNIPVQAGLGGGSSDAAAVLLALNQHFSEMKFANNTYAFTEKELIKLAAEIGADVPFFVKNKSRAQCRGIGEIITPVRAKLKGYHVLIAKPAYNISTKKAFEDFDNFRNANQFCEFNKYKNDFTALAFSQNENLKIIRGIILEYGASESELTGSGSALFGIFDDFNKAQKCKNTIGLRNDIEFCDMFNYV